VLSKPPCSSDFDCQAKFGAVVKGLRVGLGLSQEELAWQADMHQTYLSDVERGRRNISFLRLIRLVRALHVSLPDFFGAFEGPGSSEVAGPRLTRVPAPSGMEMAPAEGGEILMIEDSSLDAALTRRAFLKAGVTNPLRVIRDAEIGLDYLFGTGEWKRRKRARPQLILLDLNLPRMPGLEFLRQVKADPRTRPIPVVVLTVSKIDHMIIECGRLGADNYIVKPVSIENFVKMIPHLNLHLTVRPPVGARKKAVSP
jgi:two-component system response regulator